MNPYSLYIHIPFCRHRCAYCDFNTYEGLEHLIPNYISALRKEVTFVANLAPNTLMFHSIYFGGGTPSLMPVLEIAQLMNCISESFNLLGDIEITLEANPVELSRLYLEEIRSLGINRLSLGVQSVNSEELKLLERNHDYQDVINAILNARKAGFRNLSIDLIFGLPGQSLDKWKKNISLILRYEPEHISLYALTLETGTPMQHWITKGLMEEPDNDLAADMYELACDQLAKKGYEQYEISNWARRGHQNEAMRCVHNLQYWRNLPYFGLGAGAHGYIGNLRIANILSPRLYIQRFEPKINIYTDSKFKSIFPRTPATAHVTEITPEIEMAETLLMGLRLTVEGVSTSNFEDRFGIPLENVYGNEINSLMSQGLLENTGDVIRLTARGRLLGNRVFQYFV